MKFVEIVDRSSDSQFLSYQFSNGVLMVHLEMDELDGVYVIKIPTNLVQAKKLSSENDVLKTCRLELIELSKALIIAQGYYVPDSNFEKMMKEMRCGVSLAYGQRCSDVRWLLNIVGYSRLLSCLVTDLEEVVCYTK